MSLVVAAHNQSDIVIGSDSLSTYAQDGKPFVPDEEAQKVREVNPSLALMITGRYASDKVQLIKDYAHAVADMTDLEIAFRKLFGRARTMTVHPSEGFQIGLAGYTADGPTFRFASRAYDDPDISYVKTYPISYYLSGERQPVELAERLIRENNVTGESLTPKIESELRGIIGECISRYPKTLGEPVDVLVLSSHKS